jgi:3-hydroxyacyl-[acyl-carrier-protein] dehydratase
MKLSKEQILEVQKNCGDYLMIDEATHVEPGKSADGYKHLKNDWFFKFHFPGDPNMPGMLQIEAMMQMASLAILTIPGNKGKILYVVKADKLIFKKKILNNEILFIKTKINSWSRGYAKAEAEGFVNEELACAAKFDFVLNDEFQKYSVVR